VSVTGAVSRLTRTRSSLTAPAALAVSTVLAGVLLGWVVSTFGIVVAAILCAAVAGCIAIGIAWGTEGVVTLLLVGSMLPLPTVAVGSAGFPLATIAVVLILAAVVRFARRRGVLTRVPHVSPYVALLAVGLISLAASWLFWDARVPTGAERGYGHRSILYQVTGLYMLAVPLLAYAGGVISIRVLRVERLYTWVFLGLTGLTLVSLGTWLQHPTNPIQAFSQGERTTLDYQWTAFMVVLAVALAFHAQRRVLRQLALVLVILGALTAGVQYVLSSWLALLAALSVMIWLRFGARGIVLWIGALTGIGLLLEPTVATIIAQRASSPDVDRLKLWQSALVVWTKSPVWGVGPGNFASYMETYNAFPLGLVLQGYQQAHDTFLEIVAEDGIVGLTLLGVFVWLVVRTLLNFKATTPLAGFVRTSTLGLLVVTAVIASLGGGFVPTIAEAGYNALPKILIEWFVIGCGVGFARRQSGLPDGNHG
jgi:O-antigen ligase